jgi:hypothetical protein
MMGSLLCLLAIELNRHVRGQAAAGSETSRYFHPFGAQSGNQIIQYAVDQMLIEDAHIAILQQIEFQ